MRYLNHVFLALGLVALCSLAHADSKPTVWIYTSSYPESVKAFDAALKKQFPDYDIQWFQNGSENVHAKVALERVAKNVQADILMTADIVWYKKMAAEGFFDHNPLTLSYEIPETLKDPQGGFATSRFSTMVIGYNKKFVSEADAPKNFQSLSDPKWKGKITSGSPLESGTHYTLMINLVYKYGYDFLKSLGENDIISAGGNSAVMKRLVTGERPVAMVLLENLVKEQKNNPDIGIVYPEDGAIFAPGIVGLVKKPGDRSAAKAVYDFLFSPEANRIYVENDLLYVFDPAQSGPAGAKPFAEVRATAFDVSPAFYDFVLKEDEIFKQKFADIILN